MARLPFNPDRVPPPPPGESSGDTGAGKRRRGDAPMSVSQLATVIKDALANAFPSKLRVVGEISNFSERSHWFFSMKDEKATIRCVCFASNARRVPFRVEDGMQVVATGRLDFYDAQGHVQLYVDSLEPVGQGSLEIKFRQLCDELRKLGYFDEDRKKPLPAMPRRVAIVTSRSAAALQDVINTAAKRWRGCELMLMDVRVQGAAAAPEVAAAIDALSRQGESLGIDAIILTRGGGSIEDLWAFNERVVADAIFRCRLPIVAAIGHETDTTVAELVADRRCSTPTQAAMTLIPDRIPLQMQVDQHRRRLALLLTQRLRHGRHQLDSLLRRPVLRRPQRMTLPARERLASLRTRLTTLLPQRVATERSRVAAARKQLARLGPERVRVASERLAALTRQLRSVGPANVLQRGYSYTLGPDGRVLRSANAVSPGQRITSVLADGRVSSDVVDATSTPTPPAKPERSREASPSSPRVRKARGGDDSSDTPTLFGS